jgi:N-acyl amino acid synthase of PEP-CTERM/exosortase system
MVAQNLQDLFYKYFEVLTDTDTPDVVDEAQKLRYQVYCKETGFEDASQFPDEKEVDSYDSRSVHSIIRHRETGIVAATVRLVLPNTSDPGQSYPIEEHCSQSFEKAGLNKDDLPRNTLAELSRFGISKDFKRRLGEAGTLAGVGPDADAYSKVRSNSVRLIPHLSLGLFAAIVRMSTENYITHWYAVMEPSLLRLLTRFGISFMPIGGVVDYHGQRQPVYGCANDILEGMWKERLDVWELVTGNGTVWPSPENYMLDSLQSRLGGRGSL